MRYLLALLLMVTGCRAASPSYSSFEPTQFATNNLRISIKNGVLLTNITVKGSASLPSGSTVGGNLISTNIGATINPTDNYLPYRSNATTFGDSPWYRINTNDLGFNGTGRFLFSDSNVGNLGLGNAALDSLTSGTLNTTFGYFSMSSLQAGIQNTAFGYYSMRDAVGATYNTAFGLQSLRDNVGATFNTAVGWNSLRGTTGDNNTALGASAGITNITGAGNVFLGLNANPNADNQDNQIVIGANVVSAGPNTTVIGNTNTTAAHIIASGYTGAGTLFLSDDGTYKTAGGGGGSSPFTNIAGIVQFSPGQAVTNELRVVSGSADAATNVAFRVDTANLFTASGSLLAAFGNAGTNQLFFGPLGAIAQGARTLDPNFNGPLTGNDALISYSVFSNDGLGRRIVNISSVEDESYTSGADISGSAISTGADPSSNWQVSSYSSNSVLVKMDTQAGATPVGRITINNGSDITLLEPTVASSGSAVAYLFDTSNVLTNGDTFASFRNKGTQLLGIAAGPGGSAQIIFGPGTTNVLYRGADQSLNYTNGITGTVTFNVSNGIASANKTAKFGVNSGANTVVIGDVGRLILLSPDNGSASYVAAATAFYPLTLGLDLGSNSGTSQFDNMWLNGAVIWNGTTNSVRDSTSATASESVVSAGPGSLNRRFDNGTLELKKAGTGNTGWETVHSGNMAYLAADATSVDTTFANLSLSATVQNGKKYSFKLVIFLANSTPTDGAKFDFDGGSATATNFRVHGTAFGSALSGSAQSSALATDHTVATVTGDNMMEFNGSFEPSSSGTFIPRFAENVDAGGTLTVYRGSNLILTEIP